MALQRGPRRWLYFEVVEEDGRVSRLGRWEGDVLVVETVGFLPGVLNSPVRHSDQLRVVERFSLDAETMTLRREYEATDPVYLQGTYTGSDAIQGADAPYTDDNCDEQAFIDDSLTQGRP
jgi:hypothetical protein